MPDHQWMLTLICVQFPFHSLLTNTSVQETLYVKKPVCFKMSRKKRWSGLSFNEWGGFISSVFYSQVCVALKCKHDFTIWRFLTRLPAGQMHKEWLIKSPYRTECNTAFYSHVIFFISKIDWRLTNLIYLNFL